MRTFQLETCMGLGNEGTVVVVVVVVVVEVLLYVHRNRSLIRDMQPPRLSYSS